MGSSHATEPWRYVRAEHLLVEIDGVALQGNGIRVVREGTLHDGVEGS